MQERPRGSWKVVTSRTGSASFGFSRQVAVEDCRMFSVLSLERLRTHEAREPSRSTRLASTER